MSKETERRIKERNRLLKQLMIHKTYQAEAKDLLPTANGYMEIVYGKNWDKDKDKGKEKTDDAISVIVAIVG